MISVEVEDPAWTAALPDAEIVATRAAEATLRYLSAHPDESRDPGFLSKGDANPEKAWGPTSAGVGGFDLTILLADDEALRDLNARFRGKDRPTNVLSFPATASARPHLGDVALAFGVCSSEAEAQGKPLAHHLIHLVAHGVLHLVGYDHESEAEGEVMETLERDVLAGLGVPDPYADERPEDHHDQP